MDSDQGVAVAALEGRRGIDLDRGAATALGDQASPGRDDRPQVELSAEPRRIAIWRVKEDQIVWAARARCVANERRDVEPADVGLDPEALEIGLDRLDRRGIPIYQGGPRRAARQRLDRQRPRSRIEVGDGET